MRLTTFQRVGIVASIIWVVSAGIYTYNADVERAESFTKFAYKVCSDNKFLANDSDLTSCDNERTDHLKTWMEGSGWNIALNALMPIPVGWLVAFILIYIARAQLIGFRAVVPWSRFGWPKKTFVVFCVLAGAAAIILGTTAILNLYVDTQVLVALPPFLDVTKSGDLVLVQGTWVRSGSIQGSSFADPLQTSRIECNKIENRCTEARASISGNVLTFPELIEYGVESWTGAALVLRNNLLCATEVFTIDLNTKSVTGARHPINEDTEFCKLYGGNEKEWKYQLSNGFKIYWEQRQKARPLPLRLIQALFGN